MIDIQIRPATAADAAGVATVHVRTWQCAYKGQVPDTVLDTMSIPDRTPGWEEQLAHPEENTFQLVAEADGKIIGWCTGGKSKDERAPERVGELYGIYILPEYIGKGAGSLLMKKALETLQREGYAKATLWVLDTNEKTIAWYKHKGWQPDGTTKVDKRDGYTLNEARYAIDVKDLESGLQ